MADDDQDIRREYNDLRFQIASLLREINDLRDTDEDERNIIDLDAYRIAIDEESTVTNGELDELIREEKITPVMATSLMKRSQLRARRRLAANRHRQDVIRIEGYG